MLFTSSVGKNVFNSFPLFVFLPLVYQQYVSQTNEVVGADEKVENKLKIIRGHSCKLTTLNLVTHKLYSSERTPAEHASNLNSIWFWHSEGPWVINRTEHCLTFPGLHNLLIHQEKEKHHALIQQKGIREMYVWECRNPQSRTAFFLQSLMVRNLTGLHWF